MAATLANANGSAGAIVQAATEARSQSARGVPQWAALRHRLWNGDDVSAETSSGATLTAFPRERLAASSSGRPRRSQLRA